ncbi:MAG: ZIP family metal transporter [Candidatus Aenigmarchaeota archaeon]|nr:ZIP family metal transporter [Candidatus Aenigmarchaeota archaeon]
MVFLLALGIVFLISLLGLSGGLLLIYKQKWAKFVSKYMISFAIGAMLGVVFLDMLPEALGVVKAETVLTYTLAGILLFYLLEKTLLLYHHHSVEHIWHRNKHHPDEKAHPVGYLITFGDALHNFMDGLIIAAGFLIDFRVGLATSLAVLFHEVPQEIGEFAILLHARFRRAKIILYSLFAQMTAVLGFIVGFYYLPLFENMTSILISLAAGGFIYIASTDLLPETHREKKVTKSAMQFALLILGILVIWYVGVLVPE